MRRDDPTHRWRGGRVAEGGGLLNRYTVNPVSWVRIPSPPPPFCFYRFILHSSGASKSPPVPGFVLIATGLPPESPEAFATAVPDPFVPQSVSRPAREVST